MEDMPLRLCRGDLPELTVDDFDNVVSGFDQVDSETILRKGTSHG